MHTLPEHASWILNGLANMQIANDTTFKCSLENFNLNLDS
jgi:hypothetical protein